MNLNKNGINAMLAYIVGGTAYFTQTGTSTNSHNVGSRYLGLAYDVTWSNTGYITDVSEPASSTGYARIPLNGNNDWGSTSFDNALSKYTRQNKSELVCPTARETYPREIKYFVIFSSLSGTYYGESASATNIIYVGELQQTEQTWTEYGADAIVDKSGPEPVYTMAEEDKGRPVNTAALSAFKEDLDYYYKGADGVYSLINKYRTVYQYTQISEQEYNAAEVKPVIYKKTGDTYTEVSTEGAILDFSANTYYITKAINEPISPSVFGDYLYVGIPAKGLRYIVPEKYTKPVIMPGSIKISIQ